MYDSIAYLWSEDSRTYDTYLNEHVIRSRRKVFVQPKSVYNSEFYNASILGLHPSISLTLANRADYNGEKIVEFEDKIYTVIRVDWRAQRDAVTLVLEERTNVPNETVTTEGD